MEAMTAVRRNGKIILEIDEQQFMRTACDEPSNSLRVTDRERFLQFALSNVFTLTHDVDEIDQRASWWLRLSQALGKAAAATEQGVRRSETPAPTCGCDPEIHDGG